MSFSMISSMGNFLPKKTVVAGGGVSVSGLWVAVGNGPRIVYSPYGNSWTAATSVGFTNRYDVAYGKNGTDAELWVAVGVGMSNGSSDEGISSIRRSSSGTSWLHAGNVGGITNGYGVAYGKDGDGNGRWVAVGQGSVIAYSSNGNIWTRVNADSDRGSLTGGFSVAYGNGRWVAVGSGSKIAHSSNGNSWTAAASVGGIDVGYGVAYGKDGNGNGRWVVVGSGSKIAHSSDGNNWQAATQTGTFSYGNRVAYGKDAAGNGRWVAVGGGSKIVFSPDGNSWTDVNSNLLGGSYTSAYNVAYGKDGDGNGRWVIVAGDYTIAYSSNGNTWTGVGGSNGGITFSSFGGVAFKRILYDGVDF